MHGVHARAQVYVCGCGWVSGWVCGCGWVGGWGWEGGAAGRIAPARCNTQLARCMLVAWMESGAARCSPSTAAGFRPVPFVRAGIGWIESDSARSSIGRARWRGAAHREAHPRRRGEGVLDMQRQVPRVQPPCHPHSCLAARNLPGGGFARARARACTPWPRASMPSARSPVCASSRRPECTARCRCGQGRAPVPVQMWAGEPSPGADVGG